MATKTTYDYNTGKPLQAGQAQSLYNTQTGQKIGVPASTNPLANQSTTTLSTANAQNKVVGITNKQTTLGQSGVTTDPQTGTPTYANGTVALPPDDPSNKYNTQTGGLNTNWTGNKPVKETNTDGTSSTGGYFGNVYIPAGGAIPQDNTGKPVNLTATNPANDEFKAELERQKSQSDANGASNLTNIGMAYDNLIKQQEQANSAAKAGTTAYLVGGGAGVVSSDNIMLQQVSYGLNQIGALNLQKQQAIVQAQQSILDGDYKYATALHDQADKISAMQQEQYTKVQDTIAKATKDLQDKQEKITSDINNIAMEAKKNGATSDITNAILNSKDVGSAIDASGSYLQTGTGVMADYLQYKRSAEGKGLVPLDYMTFKEKQDAIASKLKASEAYSSAYNSAAGKAAAEKKYGTGTDNKPATQAQFTAAGFANRVVQSKDLIDVNVPKITKLGTTQYLTQKNLPNFMQSDLVQKELQAERNFVNAVLRRESGAAISPTEFDSAAQQYFPQPGDSVAVLDQKKANRDLTAQNLINESGTAYKTDPIIQEQKANDEKVTTGLKNIQSTNPTLYKTASEMYTSVNPTTGKPYSAEEILQAFPELNN